VRLVEVADSDELGRRAAEFVLLQLAKKQDSVITFATGKTPLPLFRELVAASRTNPDLFRDAHFVTLDEYADIALDDRRRLLSWLRREFLQPAGIPDHKVVSFDPLADHRADCERIEAAIAALGGLDLAVLGLGPNGHLAFNEPGSSFDSRTHRVALAPESLLSNASYWGSPADVPAHGLTLGLGTIKQARQILLLVSGEGKADIVSRLLRQPVSETIPASLLLLCDHSIMIADDASLSRSRLGQLQRQGNTSIR
jgi:glucosamine-6-phosphate deaminase